MRTAFSPEQLADPEYAASQKAIRTCVHCGFCTATCPTYVLLGDERDGPRGRIELIQAMLESDGPPSPAAVKHVDRCLSCLGCATTCPSGVDYAQLIGHARSHIERHGRSRPARWARAALTGVLTRPRLLAGALALGRLARPLGPLLQRLGLAPLGAMLRLTPARAAPAPSSTVLSPAEGVRRGRVVLLQGCVEPALAPQIRAAAVRLITRAGFDVLLAPGEGCCGALPEHLGQTERAKALAAANLRAWAAAGPVEAVITTAAGCGTTLKGYGHLLAQDPLAADAAAASARARDVLEFIAEVGLPPVVPRPRLTVAYHAPCSLQHGQKIRAAPARLLAEAGFEVREPAEAHLCCGSAGVYNILQPAIAADLGSRKAAHLARTGAQVVAAGNIGCITQLAPALEAPVIHPVELLDWATGGPQAQAWP